MINGKIQSTELTNNFVHCFVLIASAAPQSSTMMSGSQGGVSASNRCHRQLVQSDVCFQKVIIVSNDELKVPDSPQEVEGICR